jgi:hypothetical protein
VNVASQRKRSHCSIAVHFLSPSRSFGSNNVGLPEVYPLKLLKKPCRRKAEKKSYDGHWIKLESELE